MSELKRYEPSCDDVTIGSMDEELEGDYVEYADYARLKAAADTMAKALVTARSYLASHKEYQAGFMQAEDDMNKCDAALAAYKEATR